MDWRRVQFNPPNMYARDVPARADIVRRVLYRAPNGAAIALVVNGWHTSRSDPGIHCTVDYWAGNGEYLGRVHIPQTEEGERP
ncbi:hypothetical protein GGR51DRAFT_521274 [Nemania sp. FL0031]|nr:hypothetical protein GGR51DRAFT_521274 [Nemania sp. FL0031]